MFPHADQFAGKDANVLVCLFSHGGVALSAFGGLHDEGFGLLLGRLQLLDVAVEFAHVLADEGVAFPLLLPVNDLGGVHCSGVAYLLLWCRLPYETLDRLHRGQLTCVYVSGVSIKLRFLRCVKVDWGRAKGCERNKVGISTLEGGSFLL